MGLCEILRCGELSAVRVGLLIGTSTSRHQSTQQQPGRVSSLCFCTLPTLADPTSSFETTSSRPYSLALDPSRTTPLTPASPTANSVGGACPQPRSASDVPHLIFSYLSLQAPNPPTRASSHRRLLPQPTPAHIASGHCTASGAPDTLASKPTRELSSQQRRPPCPCPLRSSTPQCAPSTRAAAKQYVFCHSLVWLKGQSSS